MVDPEATENVMMVAHFMFTDTEQELIVIIRRGVCIVQTENHQSEGSSQN